MLGPFCMNSLDLNGIAQNIKIFNWLFNIFFITGNYENLLSSLSVSEVDTCTTMTRHSSYTWLHDEEEDTCLLATQLRRRYEEVRRSAMEQSAAMNSVTEDCIMEAEAENQETQVSNTSI